MLKYTYVWRMAPEQVQTRMRKAHGAVLRGRRFELVLADAHRAISQSLVKLTADSAVRKIASTGCNPPDSVLRSCADYRFRLARELLLRGWKVDARIRKAR
ncbi:hypothetical protein [Burkholderia multivorans]|uniref:hypothetical protein n=1 Tax=Burkholderia multivorans TaxID=87883 RepID=UPI002157C17E|nr:hypothetical protein [Burkholderia multivorans]MDN7477759.1 hypothetical protein [Burkholderia multivorans]